MLSISKALNRVKKSLIVLCRPEGFTVHLILGVIFVVLSDLK